MSEENMLDPNMDIVIIIDKDKLPEELRNKLPQDLQNILEKLLQEKTTSPSNLFTVQHGTVVGNIYKDGIAPEEKFIKTKVIQENNNIHQECDKNIPFKTKR